MRHTQKINERWELSVFRGGWSGDGVGRKRVWEAYFVIIQKWDGTHIW